MLLDAGPPVPPPPPPPPAVTPAEDLLSTADLDDLGARLALTGGTIEIGVQHLKAIEEAELASLAAQADAEMTRVTDELAQAQRDLDEVRGAIEHTTKVLEEFRVQRDASDARVKHGKDDVRKQLMQLQQLRLIERKSLFDKQAADLALSGRERQQELLELFDLQKELLHRRFELKKEVWALNQDEYQRIVHQYEEEKRRINERIATLRPRLDGMQAVGITRPIARFLRWAGYAGLAGIGPIVIPIVVGRREDKLLLIANFLQGLRQLVGIKDHGTSLIGLFVPLLAYLGLIVVALGVVVGATWLLNRFLDRFDPRWSKNKISRNEASPLSAISSWFDGPGKALQRLDRSAHSQLLAAFPSILVAAILAFAIAALAPGNETSSQAGMQLTGAYLGLVIGLLTTSGALLYAMHIIEPRWERLSAFMTEKRGTLRYVLLHWEFAVFIACAGIALVSAVFLGGPSGALWAWISTASFLCVSSLGLAYGLIYHGIFNEIEYLERKRQLYNDLIDRYSVHPSIDTDFADATPLDAESILGGEWLTRHKLIECKILENIRSMYEDDHDGPYFNTLVRHLLPDFATRKNERLLPPRRAIETPELYERPELFALRYEVPPELLVAFQQSIADRDAAQHEFASTTRRIDETIGEQSQHSARRSTVEQQISTLRDHRTRIVRELERDRAAIIRRHEIARLRLTLAFQVGTAANAWQPTLG